MPPCLKLQVTEDAHLFECDLPPQLMIGRQDILPDGKSFEGDPVQVVTRKGQQRLIIGWNGEAGLSREHASLELLPNGQVRIRNRSSNFTLDVSDRPDPLKGGEEVVLRPPFRLTFGRRTVRVALALAESGPQSLAERTRTPGNLLTRGPQRPSLPRLESSQFAALANWLQETLSVLQSTVGSEDFLNRAAEALVNIVGLHRAQVLLGRDGNWTLAAQHSPASDSVAPSALSEAVLALARTEKTTCWESLPASIDQTAELTGRWTALAAPLLAPNGEVIGALYGELHQPTPPGEHDRVKAVLVDLLATAVSSGLARRDVEHNRTLLEQFFDAEMARRLRKNPEIIERAYETTVTVLFCDIRNYSRVSAALGPADTLRWLSDVLETLSACVIDQGGVLIDYIGDELFAMWGAPEPQPDHALRAVRAAMAMLKARPALDARWQQLGFPTDLGIGLNTGIARVGNVGTTRKFKYGPLGDTVNVGSRTQGLCKHLKCRLLATAETREFLGDGFMARRVARVRFLGLERPRDLYELAATGEVDREFFAASEAALDALEDENFPRAARLAGALLQNHSTDGPLQLTLSRASSALLADGATFDPVWPAPGK